MKSIFILLASFLVYYTLNAQENRIWGTYYGNTGSDTYGYTECDNAGNVYLAGTTGSTSGISYMGFQNTIGGGNDAYLVKFDANGNRLWATYYGGSGGDVGLNVAVDGSGNVYLCGLTNSASGIASGGHDNSYGGNNDAFLVKFDPNGNRLWATYYGGAAADNSYGLCIDGNGNVFLAGVTSSTTAISSLGFQNTLGGGSDAYVVKFDSNGNRLWATYYGGASSDDGYGLAADADNNVYLTGMTQSTSGIAASGFQNIWAGSFDGMLVKFDPNGNRLWATYYGGSGYDAGEGVCVDDDNNVYIGGFTQSTSAIASGGFQNVYGGGTSDKFMVKFNSSGSRLWATYYGGTGTEDQFSTSCSTDMNGNVYLAGTTSSTTGIASGGFQNVSSGGGYFDAFLVRFDSVGNRLAATYYGGSMDDKGYDVCIDVFGNVYFSGTAASTTGIGSGGFQNVYGGGTDDCFLVKMTNCSLVPAVTGSISGATPICEGSINTYSITAVSGATYYTWTLPSGWSGTSTTNLINTTAGSSSGQITVTANNSCGSSAAQTLNVTVNTAPSTPSSIVGSSAVCSGSNQPYSVTNDPSATSYTWTLPSGWSGSSTTHSINTTAGSSSGQVAVTANNACGSSAAATLAIMVNTVPTTPGSISGATTICEGSNNNYSVSAVPGATSYTWTLPSGWSGTSTTNSITTTASSTGGNITVAATNSCGNSSTSIQTIAVNGLPGVSLMLSVDTLCLNSAAVALSGGSPSGGIFTGTGVSGGSFNPASSGTGTFAITYTFTDANSCTNTATDDIVVDACLALPDAALAELGITIYPSPTTGMFTLICPGMEKSKGIISIYNALGEVIVTVKTTSANNYFDLSDFENGIYFVQVSIDDEIFTKKIIKK